MPGNYCLEWLGWVGVANCREMTFIRLMRRVLIVFSAIIYFLCVGRLSADEQTALGLMDRYDERMSLWLEKMGEASDEERAQVERERPDDAEQLGRLWVQINGHLDKEWVLGPLGWMLARPGAWSGLDESIRESAFHQVMDAIEHPLVVSSELRQVIPALAVLQHSRCLGILKKIIQVNKDGEVKACAHVAVAIMLRRLGDDRRLLKERREHLRSALELAGKTRFDQRLVIDVVQDELYRVQRLTAGKVSPPFTLTNEDGVEVSLVNYRGKVVVLCFWSLKSPTSVQSIPVMNSLVSDLGGFEDEVVLLGIVNDFPSVFRRATEGQEFGFMNLMDPGGRVVRDYRIESVPYVYLLDRQGKVVDKGGLSGLLKPRIEELARSQGGGGLLPPP